MSNSKLSFKRVNDFYAWDVMVSRSPQGTLFSETCYLNAVGCNYHLWWVCQGTEVKAGVCVTVSDDEQHCRLNESVIYGGILFNLDQKRQAVKRRHDEFHITEFVAERLAENYNSVELTLSPNFMDMRPFQWYNYHVADLSRYTINLRYTSHLKISELRDFIGIEEESRLFADMETVRRYSVREGRKKGGKVIEASGCNVLISYYQPLMEAQGKTQSMEKLAIMRRIIDTLSQSGRANVFHVVDANEIVLYAVAYAWDEKRAYYLFGAGHPDVSTSWQGTLLHWESFKYLAQQKGINEVDLEGVNSPQRGWFKLSLGGDLQPYYQVRKEDAIKPNTVHLT